MYRPGYPEPQPTLVGVFDAPGEWALFAHSNSATTAGFQTGGLCMYHPIMVQRPVVARAMWWANGATATGNIGAGIYADHPTDHKPSRLLAQTASTAQSGTNQIQVANITDVYLPIGIVWLALCSDSGSSTFMRVAGSGGHDAFMHMHETSVTPGSLPSTPTPATNNVSGCTTLNIFGFTTHSVYGG